MRNIRKKVTDHWITYAGLLLLLLIPLFSPLIVGSELANYLRTGKIFFFVKMLCLVSLPLIAFYLFHLKTRISVLQLLVFAWLAWMMIVGKPGGILHDEKFFYFSACFALFFMLVPLIRKVLSSNYSQLIIVPISFIAIVGCVEAIIGCLQIYGLHPIYHHQFKVTGTFFNPAPFAGFLVGVLPFAIYLSRINQQSITPLIEKIQLISPGRNKKAVNMLCIRIKQFLLNKKPFSWIGYIIIFLIIIIIPSTYSRAAYLGVLSVFGVWVIIHNQPFIIIKKWLNAIWKKALVYSVTPILLISLLGGLYLFKKDSASGRLLIWKVAIRTIEKKPILGHGFNTFQSTFAKEQSAYFAEQQRSEQEKMLAGSVSWAFNEFLQTASETGFVGMILLLLTILYALWIGFIQKGIKDRFLSVAAGCSVLGIIVFGCFSYPFYSQSITMILFISFAILAALDNTIINIGTLSKLSGVLLNITFLFAAIIIVIFLSTQYRERGKAYRLWYKADRLYLMGAFAEANESFAKAYPYLRNNGLFLQKYGKSFSMNKQYNEAIQLLQEGEIFYVDEVWFTTIGDAYKGLKKYDQSEHYYKMAANMVPHKFYPLYLLLKLYEEVGQMDKSEAIARTILEKKVKVHSTAIEEIRMEAEKILTIRNTSLNEKIYIENN